jgi:sialate O-acetylesterase
LLPGLIKDWREQWGSEVPFLFVQLPNYNDPLPNPSESHWAELREAQEMALREPNTGMVVTIDLGDASNIHPKNKKDVGDRLAQLALQTVYHKKSEGQSPLFDSHEIMDGKIRILFNNSTAPLEVRNKYGYINGFSIAGEDRKFHWAKAELEGDNSVLVHSPKVKHPVAVRYAWGDNPGDINLYNNKGLPAAPFRTDDWPGISVKNMVKY